MMYSLVFVLLFVSGVSHARVENFLSEQKFQELSAEQQIEYIKGLQTVLAKMAEKTDYMAQSNEKSADRNAASVTESEQDRKNREFHESSKKTRDAQFEAIKAKNDEGLQKHREDHKVFLEQQKKLAAESNSVGTDDFKEAFNKIWGHVSGRTKKEKEMKDAAKAADIQSESEAYDPSYKGSLFEDTKPPVKKFFRCMFAGWIVKTDPCKGPSSLPGEIIKSLNLDPANASCKPNEFACNPVLFGLKLPADCEKLAGYSPDAKDYCTKLAKPICVEGYAKPTLDCKNQGAPYIEVARQIAVQKNSNLYKEFVSEFAELCDEDQMETNQMVLTYKGEKRKNSASVLRDLKRTCNWGNDQLIALRERMGSVVDVTCEDGAYNYDEKGNIIKCKKFKTRKKKNKAQK